MCRCRTAISVIERLLAAAALLAAPLLAAAQTVTLNGSMGERAALLVIDGQPRTLSVGATVQGVKLVSVSGHEAQVEYGGRRVALTAGTPVSVGSPGAARGGNEIVITAGPGGHFLASGSINGRAVQFMVDTGATLVSMSQSDADRMGIDYRSGQRGIAGTANGQVVAWRVVLSSVRVGDVELANVPALIMPAAMEYVLLGNSFLSRFSMRRENDEMRLVRR
jgi:aspartyl protease family protein